MLYFNLIPLRILFIGIISVLLSGIFFVMRKLLTQRIRSILLCTLLILPLLAFIMLNPIKLPSEAPDWLLDIRLPDPEQKFLTQNGIGIMTEELFKTEGPVSAEISSWLTEQGYQSDRTMSEQIVHYLPLLQMIYWFGLFLSLILNIILLTRRLRRRTQFRSANASDLNQAEWQVEIAALRDETGIYRQSDIVLAGQDEHHVWAILQNWLQRTLPVPASEPSAVEPAERRQWLLKQLHLNAHPCYFITIVWLIARSLIWFNPLIDFCFKSLIHADRLETSHVEKRHNNIFHWVPSGIVLLFMIGCLTLIGWQIPQRISRDFKLLKIEDAPELAVNILDRYPRRTEPLVSWIFDQKSDDYGFALLDAEGKPIWYVPGREIWDTSYLNDLSLLDVWQISAVQMTDQSWSLMANISRYKSLSMDERKVMSNLAWHLHISLDGKLISANKVFEYQIAQLIAENSDASASLLNDGSYLLTNQRSQSASLSSDIKISLLTIDELSCFDADGKERNSFENNSWVKKFNRCYMTKATRYGFMEFNSLNEIDQFIPIRDNFVGLLNKRGTISLIPSLNPKKQIQTDLDYQAQYCFICLDSNGDEIWRKDLTDPSDGMMIQDQYQADGDMLYWQASRYDNYYSDLQSYSKAYAINDTIIALNTANATSWKLRLDEKIVKNFRIDRWIAQNDCLSLLFSGINENPNKLMICQLNRQGELIGLTKFENISDSYLYQLVEASPGRVSLFKDSGEG